MTPSSAVVHATPPASENSATEGIEKRLSVLSGLVGIKGVRSRSRSSCSSETAYVSGTYLLHCTVPVVYGDGSQTILWPEDYNH
jgi:hypothetical protein